MRFCFYFLASLDYATLTHNDCYPLLSPEGAAKPVHESSTATAALLLTRIHPYCKGRGGGEEKEEAEDRARRANKRCRAALAMALAVPGRHSAPVSSHLTAD